MTEPLEFQVRINADDYVSWSHFLHTRRRPARSKRNYGMWAAFFVGGFAVMFLYGLAQDYLLQECAEDAPKAELTLLGILPVFLLLIGYGAYYQWAARSVIKGQLQSMMAGVASTDTVQTMNWRVDTGGLRLETTDTTSNFRWSAIKSAAESADHLFLISDFASALIAPKRDIAPEVVEALREKLREQRVSMQA